MTPKGNYIFQKEEYKNEREKAINSLLKFKEKLIKEKQVTTSEFAENEDSDNELALFLRNIE